MPAAPRPIAIIGCGGIVRDAHLPAYRLAGFPVVGVFDLDSSRAASVAQAAGGARVLDSVAAMADLGDRVVYDVAVPAGAVESVIEQLPDRSAVLIQKPLGEDLAQARRIAAACRRRGLVAAVNFQLRWAPYVLAARHLFESGAIGEIDDMEVRVTVFTPWHLWKFLESSPRVEILYHSVHYIDLIRSFLGDPRRVRAKTVRHPSAPKLHSTRSSLILDYGELLRVNIQTNHHHRFGGRHQESYIKWEGSRGAIKATLGLLKNYPAGEPDALQMCRLDDGGVPGGWTDVPFEGSWFPHAFIGSMASLQRFVEGSSQSLPTSVDDAVRTMAVVEACYADSASGGTEVER